MKYGIIIKDIELTTFSEDTTCNPYEGVKAGTLFTFDRYGITCYFNGSDFEDACTKVNSPEIDPHSIWLPISVMVEISKKEYNRIKKLREPKTVTHEVTIDGKTRTISDESYNALKDIFK